MNLKKKNERNLNKSSSGTRTYEESIVIIVAHRLFNNIMKISGILFDFI
jgi:hypothetical protein